ncbi:MAG: divergent polysaccharide deacetylase family protein [Litorimonas sp.]
MTSEDPIRRVASRRRQALSLPKRRHHLSLALIALIILISTPMLMARFFGSDSDAKPKGSVSIANLPEGQTLSPLDERGDTLTDLLADLVPAGENPTDAIAAIDALGNPVGAKPSPTPKTIVLPPPTPKAPPLDQSLIRQSRFGAIPGPNRAGKTPLDAYGLPSYARNGRTPVSIIVGGLGINAALTQRAIDELPPAVTLSFAAQTPGLQGWIDQARVRGHEVLLEIPMEGAEFDATAQGTERTLRVSLNAADNRQHLYYLMSRAQGYAGVINYQGDVLLRRSDALGPILNEIKASGLGFFIDGSFDAPTAGVLAQSISLPFKTSFGLIDPAPSQSVIEARLGNLAAEAKQSPGVLGVGFVYPQTIDAVKGWAATLSSQGLILVPATATLK